MVRGVEPDHKTALAAGGRDGLPLVLGRVDTGGVVSAGVKKDHRTLRHILKLVKKQRASGRIQKRERL